MFFLSEALRLAHVWNKNVGHNCWCVWGTNVDALGHCMIQSFSCGGTDGMGIHFCFLDARRPRSWSSLPGQNHHRGASWGTVSHQLFHNVLVKWLGSAGNLVGIVNCKAGFHCMYFMLLFISLHLFYSCLWVKNIESNVIQQKKKKTNECR